MISNTIKSALAATILAGGVALSPPALAQNAIGVSYQPSLYWALPFHYATVKGWWKDAGLTPTFSTFPAGAPRSRRQRRNPGMSAAPVRCPRCSAPRVSIS